MDTVEADDALGVDQTEDTIIASIDKDLLMIPGKHYNINTGKFLEVKDPGHLEIVVSKSGKKMITGSGFKWFCAQLLLGDIVDNIIGLNRYGPVKVYNCLKDMINPRVMYFYVYSLYVLNKREADFHLNCKLLWIMRKEDQEFYEELIYDI